MICLFLSKEKRYKAAMMRAIDIARDPIVDFYVMQSKTDGLRVIRTFEDVNNITFDPFNRRHLDCIRGKAVHENFIRRARRVLKC